MGDVIGPTAQVVVGILALVATIGGANLAGRWNARTKAVEAGTPTYAEMVESMRDLDERVRRAEASLDEEREKRRSLEDRIDHLEDDRRADRSWIERTIRKVIDHDPQLVRLLLPWPSWVATTPPTLD